MTFGTNLANLRAARGMTLEEVGNRLDPPRSAQAVWKWENGGIMPRAVALFQLADLFGVSVSELTGEDMGLVPRRSSRRVPVRVMGSVHAGDMAEAVTDDVVACIPEEVAERHPSAFLLRVSGACMDNAYPDGCMVLVDPDRSPWAGCAVVARVGDEVVLRRYHAGASTLLLVADSHSGEYPDLVFTDGQEVMLEGVVVWYQAARDEA